MKQMDEKSLYAKVKKDFQYSFSTLSPYHNDWREYDDFYMAKHWTKQRASWRPDPVVNYVAYIIDQKAPQITNQRPTGVILPTTEEDAEIAQIFTQLTDVVSNRVDLDMRIDEVVRTGLLLDVAWFKVYWDNTIRGGDPTKGNVYIGDICIESPDPSNVYFDPQATRIDDCRYVIYSVPKTVQWIKETWGVDVDPEEVFETEIYNRPERNTNSERVNYFEYWYREKNTINVIYAAGGRILKHIEGVYKHGRYPFVPFVAKKNRKSIMGISEIRNIINNQKLLNKMVELPTTNAFLTSNPISLVAMNSGIDENKWSAKPGQIWKVKDVNNSVRWLEPPQLSSDIYKMIDLLTGFMERIGGVYDANTGETPGSVTAAAAIQMLQEQGSIPIKGIARNLYYSIREVYEQMIELIKEFYTEDRFIRVDTNNGGYKFMVFNSTPYQEIDFDIKVSGDNGTPATKAYISQLAADLFQQGVLLPSEYVELQENLPNKDRIVARLREQESMMQQQAQMGGQITPQSAQMPPQEQMPMQEPAMSETGQNAPNFDMMYQNAPPEIQVEIDAMLEQGMSEEDIIRQLLSLVG
jgi:hypothetical protein